MNFSPFLLSPESTGDLPDNFDTHHDPKEIRAALAEQKIMISAFGFNRVSESAKLHMLGGFFAKGTEQLIFCHYIVR